MTRKISPAISALLIAAGALVLLVAALPAQAEESATGLYIVLFDEAPLASYEGDVAGLPATSPRATGAAKLDARSAESRAYLAFLEQVQREHLDLMESALARSIDVVFSYRAAGNGVAVAMDAQEAALVAQLPGVARVRPDQLYPLDTDRGPTWIGAPAIWNGTATGGTGGTKGEGIVIGDIDTGINMHHPSYSDTPADGYTYTNRNGSGNFEGWCDPGNPNFSASYACNDKLIGAWDFVEAVPGIVEADGPEDDNGHGSHTSSTAGGNTLDGPFISGVAPHASIIMYDACYTNAQGQGLCPGAATSAAIDQATMDGVDVINYSIGGGTSPWAGDSDTFFLNAVNAGVYVAASAGNSGPGANTTGHIGPWVGTVANATHDRVDNQVDVAGMSGGTSPPADITGSSMTDAYGPAPIVYAGDYSNGDVDPEQCLNPFPPGTWTNGEIVVCDRGTIARVLKGQNVADGGAGGMVLANITGGTQTVVADPHIIPASHVATADGDAIRTWLASGSGHMASLTQSVLILNPAQADVLNASSSRGPSGLDIIKPDLAAPGTNILAAVNANAVAGYSGPAFALFTGTSMSSPHTAGSAALVRAVHPTWTPSQIKSALMLTADTDMRKENGVTAADPHDMGSGRVDLNLAAEVGFVLDETHANYLAANPGAGGDPATLNIASMANRDCTLCTWTRVLEGTAPGTIDWTVTVNTPAGLDLTANPSSFSLANGATQSVTVRAVVQAGLTLNQWAFAEVIFTPNDPSVPIAKMPVAIIPTGLGNEIFTDGFESGNISAWTTSVP
jgi:subtilisin family serine protease